MVCKLLVRSKLDYGSETSASVGDAALRRLDLIQNKCLRMCPRAWQVTQVHGWKWRHLCLLSVLVETIWCSPENLRRRGNETETFLPAAQFPIMSTVLIATWERWSSTSTYFLHNKIGADTTPEDVLLMKMTSPWVVPSLHLLVHNQPIKRNGALVSRATEWQDYWSSCPGRGVRNPDHLPPYVNKTFTPICNVYNVPHQRNMCQETTPPLVLQQAADTVHSVLW